MRKTKRQKQIMPLDRTLLLPVFTLIGFGLVQVYSSSFIYAVDTYENGLYFFSKQAMFAVAGIAVMLFLAQLKWKFSRTIGLVAFGLSLLGLVATYVPGLGVAAGGAHRWIQMPLGFRLEPSEFLKVSFPFFIASLMVMKPIQKIGRWDTALKFSLFLVPFALLHGQPDFGSMALLAIMIISILFVFGLKWRYLMASSLVTLPVFYFLIYQVPYRWARIRGFLNPWEDPTEKGFQILQSLMSFQSGGIWGAGLGQGQGKLFFLPEAHTDFTLAVLGEEAGLVGFLAILMLYGFIVFRGLQVASKVDRDFEKIVALGITILFAFQVFTNMGVVLGLLPTKGLTLPFLSYGGSSLIATCIGFGWLLNIERSFVRTKTSSNIQSPYW